MTTRIALVSASVLLLLLAGCAPTTGPTSTPTAAPTATPTEAPVPTEQTAIVVGVAGLTILDSTGTSETIPWTSGDAVIAALTAIIGSDPTFETNPKLRTYTWAEGAFVYTSGVAATAGFTVTELNGYEIRTADGVMVGSTRAEVEALPHVVIDYDGDGDGLPDSIGLEPVEEPGTTSLTVPGAVGTSYVLARFTGDVVTNLRAPAGDWRDL